MTSLRSRRALALFLPLALLMAGCARGPDENAGDNGNARADGDGPSTGPGFTTGFEDALTGWTVGGSGNAPLTPTTDSAAAHGGAKSLLIDTSEVPPDSLVWVTRTVDVTPGQGYAVRMSVWTKAGGDEDSRPAEALLYVGADAPTGTESFDPANAGARHMALREALTPGTDWREHVLDWGTPGPDSGKLHVAIGIDTAGAPAPQWFDDLVLTLTPL